MKENLFNFISDNLIPWLFSTGWKFLAIIAGAYFIHKFSGYFIEKTIRKMIRPNHFTSKEAEKKREDTLIRIFSSTAGIVVWMAAFMILLSETGINIGPLIASAGIVGLAFGFGGQYLIKDLITGFFIIMENQYRVGDVVCFDGTCGLVEDITMRATILRNLDGTVIHVPHGEIKKVSNMSKDFARVNIDVGVSYSSDLEKVIEVINDTGHDLADDEGWKDKMVNPPQFLRVDSFAESAIVVKILGETKPLQQWAVAGEFRKRLKIAFDKNGITIPFPQRVIHQTKQ
ncbi:MAG: mechanosensitive ion channel family protein [Candidatus Terrybacteria bacterium CG10_big_fil_rev_8_21_14_0_10_41_10]|uniref:Mechanosensitive ion channel family protein n=1 Tax=Candidatus Terrybacteria bacterium CG10_big_fil_rev_8_21_14_0_10_41_10 TaxID=1975026 RepID=A0A2M8LAE5_9BACT|nr:MAG: mechanosensitive ion channel family protein [Candidatus Terrybacteria bacterium CG10_big_fil_rev_8_21_14_0_10_41_10]